LRKPVNYTVDDLEIDDVEKSLDQGDKEGFNKETLHQGFSSAQEALGDGGIGIKDNEQLEVGDSSLQSFSRDYLEGGDGFCFDGEEVGVPGVDRNSYFSKVELSDDHLERGGGFCLDESDAGMDQGTNQNPPSTGDLLEDVEHGTELLNEVRDGGRTSASETELNADSVVAAGRAGGHLKSSVSGPEITKNETGATGGGGSLSAMPYLLKRKRRKM